MAHTSRTFASTLIVSAFYGMVLGDARAVEPTAAERETAGSWVDSRLAVGPEAKLPFGFVYGGKASSELLPGWVREGGERRLDERRTERTISFTDPVSGLRIRCVATIYRDFPAVEWVLHFRNTGRVDTPILEDVKALDSDLASIPRNARATLHHAEGSHALITDFRPRERTLEPGRPVVLSSFGGRPSDGTLPFLNLASSNGGGVTIDVGWTGQWTASFDRDRTGFVRVKAGMEAIHTRLRPGEEIRSPSILLVFWDGLDRMRGQNLHRRALRTHYTPNPVFLPCAASPHAIIGFEKTTEANMRGLIRNVAGSGASFDTWWIDAGWYTCGDNWARHVGNPDPDPVRFPKGMRPIADAAHSAGMKFLLWFEPERVMPWTWLHRNHPDWLIAPPRGMARELQYQSNDGFHLLDLGTPPALAWLIDKLSAMIGESGIDCYRNDFNMYPAAFWHADEPADRVGIREIQYVTGLYTLFDTLRRRHPGLLIDTCASGGRRIDIEMLRRALVLTRSDYLWDPVGQQCHTFGLAQWIPITGIGAASLDPYSCRSGLGSHYTLAVDYASRDRAVWSAIRRILAEQHELRPLFAGDFYPLGSYGTSAGSWMAWQFHRDDLGEGVVQAFRRPDCERDSATYRLSGLVRGSRYELRDLDTKSEWIASGEELSDRGLTIRIGEKPGASILRYRLIKD